MTGKGIACFDMDMTLLDHRTWEIPASAKEALVRLKEFYYIVISTGRDLDSKFSNGLKDLVNPDAVIHLNGTKVTVGDQLIAQQFMDPELVRQLLDFSKSEGLAVGISTGEADYFTNPERIIASDKRRWGESTRTFKDPYQLLKQRVHTMTYIGLAEGATRIETYFPQLKLPLFSSGEGADIVERTVSKADGLKLLCDYYQVSQNHTVAFGDSMNDYEIIQAAGKGIAMGNSVDQLKKVADYVTTQIHEDGVWNACITLKLFK